jgi:hypothetical protein
LERAVPAVTGRLQSLRAWRQFLPAGKASIVLRNLMSIGVIEAC